MLGRRLKGVYPAFTGLVVSALARPEWLRGGDRGGGQAMTFSLAGRCERTGAVGTVIASASMAVAARCVAVRAGAGAVCSQSTTDPRLRQALLEAMAGGQAAHDALVALVGRTPDIADPAGGRRCRRRFGR